jgi:NADH-quinone oxidoreductase subunit J
MEAAIFYALAALVVIPAVLMVTMRSVFHSALWLILSLLGVGGLYAMLAADFLFAVQLLVYAGGIMVVLLFVVLLSGKPSDWAGVQVNDKALGAALFSVFFVVIIITAILNWPMTIVASEPQVTTGRLGELFMSGMVLPLEVISLVLVVALVGAIFFSSKKISS